MGYSFEDLDARSLSMKMVHTLDKRFSRYVVLKIWIQKIKGKSASLTLPCLFLNHPISTKHNKT
jgi:hypothetical protein